MLSQDRDDRSQYGKNDAAVLGIGRGECFPKLVCDTLPCRRSFAVFSTLIRLTNVRWIRKELFSCGFLPKKRRNRSSRLDP